MNKSVRIIVIAISAGILAFSIFMIGVYWYTDSVFNKMFGGHLYTDYDKKVEQVKNLQTQSQALLDDGEMTHSLNNGQFTY